jgi:hypothetical protein
VVIVALVAVEVTAVTAAIVGVEMTVVAVVEVVADPNRPPGKFICSKSWGKKLYLTCAQNVDRPG